MTTGRGANHLPTVQNDRVGGDLLGERLCHMCVLPSGRLPGLRFHDHGARAAALIDLVFWRRVSRAASSALVTSTTPTGVPAADKILGYIERHPTSTADEVLAKAPGRMADFLPTATTTRHWYPRRPRIDPGQAKAERQRLADAIEGDIDTPRTAALVLLADVLRLVTLAERDTVLNECGEARWIVTECVDYLLQLRDRYELGVAAGSIGSGG